MPAEARSARCFRRVGESANADPVATPVMPRQAARVLYLFPAVSRPIVQPRQKAGVNRASMVSTSRRPISMVKLITHLAASGRGWNVPAGPIMSPRPGPTLAMVVAAPDSAVTGSSPISDSNTADTANAPKKQEHKAQHRAHGRLGNRLCVISDRAHGARARIAVQIGQHGRGGDLVAENLDRAGARSGAAAHKHQQEEHHDRHGAPTREIRTAIAGAGHHRDRIDRRDPPGRQSFGINAVDNQQQGQRSAGDKKRSPERRAPADR